MNHPYLLPWVRVLLLIRSIASTTWGHEAWPEAALGLYACVATATVGLSENRLEAIGEHACTSLVPLIVELRGRALPTEHARQRVVSLYEIARTSACR